MKAKFETYPEYKDSGVKWLGEIPKGWELKRFKHFYYCSMGETILANDLSEEGFPVYSATEEDVFFGRVEKRHIELSAGDLVIPARGNSIGFPKIVTQESTTTQTTIYAKMANKIHPKFSYYYLLGCKPYIFRFVQTAIPQITVDEVKNNMFLQPSEDEQIAIANFLDDKVSKIDEAIAQKEQLIQLLNERKQIIIQNAVTKGLNPNAPMKDSGIEWIGKIPEHWGVVTNATLFHETKIAGEEGLPVLSVSIHTGVSDNELSAEENRHGAIKIADKTSYKLVETDDITFNMMRAWQGGLGRVPRKGLVSPAYIVAKPNEKISSRFFELQSRTPLFIAEIDRASKGITDFRKRLYWDEFKTLKTVLPPIKEQNSIGTKIDEIDASISRASKDIDSQIDKLKEYKATLINSAVTGKINVANHGL